eukprot:gnl/TRDRNA2_/TRDRNA2_200259_c0_seq1.p1 gnl/TRDRNA2_/TRDRNA2_200259_c0~~gnl/TRDRNA2_/TRDRNA2_200259_c0_seq1.p1  ORF type:complete len:404 (+),score=83.62 gnl/TRDRNA2_/TRDRNA2_200259_c0_seq1:119-1330(+)
MCRAYVITLFALVTKTYSRELAAAQTASTQRYADRLLDHSVDKLLKRARATHGANLDHTALEKASGHLALSAARAPQMRPGLKWTPTASRGTSAPSWQFIRMPHSTTRSASSGLSWSRAMFPGVLCAAETGDAGADTLLEISDLWVSAEKDELEDMAMNKEPVTILKGLNLTIKSGEVHAILGQNGCGKSTLGKTIVGHPSYTVTQGSINFKGKDLLEMKVEERCHEGVFMSYQEPIEVPGFPQADFLRMMYNAKANATGGKQLEPLEFYGFIMPYLQQLELEPDKYLNRGINQDFSGGQKKRNEMLQMAVLNPDFAIFDEIDSGLDMDALKLVAKNMNVFRDNEGAVKSEKPPGMLIITHYRKLLEYVKPDVVHIMLDGKVRESGGQELLDILEQEGYSHWK